MSTQDELNPAERELAAALRRLRPSAPGLNRDELLYAAGMAAGRRVVRRWQVSTALLGGLAAAALLAPMILPMKSGGAAPGTWVPGPAPVRVVNPTPPGPPTSRSVSPANGLASATNSSSAPMNALPSATPAVATTRVMDAPWRKPSAADYLALRNRVLREGLSALPETRSATGGVRRDATARTSAEPLDDAGIAGRAAALKRWLSTGDGQ